MTRGKNPKSLANLRPFQPGNKANAGGVNQYRIPSEIRLQRKSNLENLIKMFSQFVGMTQEQAEQRMAMPESIQLEQMIQGVINRSKEGDSNAFRFIIDIVCGQIPQNDPADTEELNPTQKLALLKQAIKMVSDEAKEVSGQSDA